MGAYKGSAKAHTKYTVFSRHLMVHMMNWFQTIFILIEFTLHFSVMD